MIKAMIDYHLKSKIKNKNLIKLIHVIKIQNEGGR
ncbi:hypothetical protein MsAc7_05210 [Methanolapillus millepedarum]|uniref:Uncharacterized protein n=1 Tax=Methanolapillus millepedarum TaxID=3028296 RepID=A0AA96V242_9EURY|nr:hypothetical protein MsAc7_05210 [Methanosarcinaceae archaeon Ac7]